MTPLTRKEIFLAAAGGADVTAPSPITREEHFLSAIASKQTPTLTPETRQEQFLNDIISGNTPTLTPITREEIWLDAIARKQECGLTPISREESFLNQILEVALIPSEPEEEWEKIYEGENAVNADTPYPYFWISALADVYPTEGSVWKVSIDENTYRVTAFTESTSQTVMIGNTLYFNGEDNEVNAPFVLYNAGWGAWAGGADLATDVNYALKIEKLVGS